MSGKLSPNGEKALLLLFVGSVGWDDERSPAAEDTLARLAGLTDVEARAAFRECEDMGLIQKHDSPRRGQG
jgi:hypothetical protein